MNTVHNHKEHDICIYCAGIPSFQDTFLIETHTESKSITTVVSRTDSKLTLEIRQNKFTYQAFKIYSSSSEIFKPNKMSTHTYICIYILYIENVITFKLTQKLIRFDHPN